MIVFDELLDAARVRFGVSVTGQRIAAAGRFDQDIRPQDAGLDVDGSNFVDADADFIDAEPGAFVPNHRLVGNFDAGWEKRIALRPTTGLENIGCHKSMPVLVDSGGTSNPICAKI